MRRSLLLAVLFLVAGAAPAGAAAPLKAGAGLTDITPPRTGYFLGGWTRADRLALGQSTRLRASALVLQRGKRKLALAAVELFAVPAGLQEAVAERLKARGFNRTNVILAATHTHSGPGGYANNPTYNTAAPSMETVDDPTTFYEFFEPVPADRQLYTFLVDRIAAAIAAADRDRARAVAGWGRTRIAGLTQNRSIEAHLANHSIRVPYGEGSAEQDPQGVLHTIDPAVDVLRVDKLRRGGRRIPIGAWSNFANHGTVVHSETQAYSGDHHAAAWRRFSALVRRAGRVPKRQTVVNVYPNSAEGDQTAGIVNVGPAAADRIGTVEAGAMFRAWRKAGKRLTARPALAGRWTRACFCGRMTSTGPVAAEGRPGIGFLTGSEEGRGPLFDVTGVPFEGRTSPFSSPDQGNKVVIPAGSFPPAVPLAVWRIGDRAMATIPGEGTKEFGARVRAGVGEAMPGIRRVVLAGLANEFIQYITTPEEYGQQSYEGASTLYGPNEGTFLVERLAELGAALSARKPAPEPYDLDASYGVRPDGEPYPPGAEAGAITAQPGDVARLERATLEWTGAPAGGDLPNGRAFVTAQARVGRRWRPYANDLGLQFLWRSDAEGRYVAQWEVPLSAPTGRYRLVVTAQRYRLASAPFRVSPSGALSIERVAGGVRLRYPEAVVDVDLTARPAAASGGVVRTAAGTVFRRRRGSVFGVPDGAEITYAADRFGNHAGAR